MWCSSGRYFVPNTLKTRLKSLFWCFGRIFTRPHFLSDFVILTWGSYGRRAHHSLKNHKKFKNGTKSNFSSWDQSKHTQKCWKNKMTSFANFVFSGPPYSQLGGPKLVILFFQHFWVCLLWSHEEKFDFVPFLNFLWFFKEWCARRP